MHARPKLRAVGGSFAIWIPVTGIENPGLCVNNYCLSAHLGDACLLPSLDPAYEKLASLNPLHPGEGDSRRRLFTLLLKIQHVDGYLLAGNSERIPVNQVTFSGGDSILFGLSDARLESGRTTWRDGAAASSSCFDAPLKRFSPIHVCGWYTLNL
jgi:hypothetical protein